MEQDAQVLPADREHPGAGSFALVVVLAILLLPAFLIGNGNNTAALIATIFFFAGSIVLYFAPGIVAMVFHHPHQTGITVLNFFLGWTVIGWMGALVWAFTIPKAAASEAQSTDDGMRACPYCAETIRAAAIKCKHCGSELKPAAVT